MNFLAHMFLAGDDEPLILGNMIADFIRHGEGANYPLDIQRGIWLHRRIDAFTDPHPVVLKSIGRIDSRFHLLKGVMVDLFYDHFLARLWDDYAPEKLEAFTTRIYAILHANEEELPPRLRRILPYMSEQNWLVNYRDLEGIDRALGGISRRISRPNRLAEGGEALRNHYAELETDFREFFPLLQDYVKNIDFPANLFSSS